MGTGPTALQPGGELSEFGQGCGSPHGERDDHVETGTSPASPHGVARQRTEGRSGDSCVGPGAELLGESGARVTAHARPSTRSTAISIATRSSRGRGSW